MNKIIYYLFISTVAYLCWIVVALVHPQTVFLTKGTVHKQENQLCVYTKKG